MGSCAGNENAHDHHLLGQTTLPFHVMFVSISGIRSRCSMTLSLHFEKVFLVWRNVSQLGIAAIQVQISEPPEAVAAFGIHVLSSSWDIQ